MSEKVEDQISVIEDIASRLPLIDKNDLSSLTGILTSLESLSKDSGLHLSVRSIAEKSAKLAELMLMGETSFESGCKKLAQSIGKISHYLKNPDAGISVDQEEIKPVEIKKSTDNPNQSMSLSVDPSLIRDFISESRDHIQTAETLLLEMESDPTNSDHLNSIFRSFHTIKGVAGFLGLKEISELSHSMENLMDTARKGELTLDALCIDMFLESTDCLKEFTVNLESFLNGDEYKIPDSYHAISSKLNDNEYVCKSIDQADCSNTKKIGEILIETGVIGSEVVSETLEMQKQGDSRKFGEILVSEKGVPVRSVADALASQSTSKRAGIIEETIRVPVVRLDHLIDSIGEAVIAQSMISADPVITDSVSQSLSTKVAQANLIMRQIQQLSMSLRMISIKPTFQKMARLVRDLSKKSGKEVEFYMDGEDTEIDKSVVENIGDPLIHMIRNSIDHGIEPAAERLQKGKPSKGAVYLKAFHKAGSVNIEIKDDGKGLDKEAIFNKAVQKKLCSKDSKLTDQEIFQFIFLPGFSTASRITDISGRGVGMDVVKKNIDALRGTIEILSEQGKGTTFTIRLPLTLAIIDGMVVRTAGENYIVPTLSIIETIAAGNDNVETVLSKGEMLKVRGKHFPLINLAKFFGKNGNNSQQNHSKVALIVEDTVGKSAGLLVDEILGKQQVVIKNIGSSVIDVPGITGGAIMSDGTVSLILDITGILKTVL